MPRDWEWEVICTETSKQQTLLEECEEEGDDLLLKAGKVISIATSLPRGILKSCWHSDAKA